jgi:uncharacterized protein with HEPN domain
MGHDEAALRASAEKRDAIERCLERISEAASKLGTMAEALMPDQHWQGIRALGNVLRHEYDNVDAERIWQIVVDDLPSLKAACERALKSLRERP